MSLISVLKRIVVSTGRVVLLLFNIASVLVVVLLAAAYWRHRQQMHDVERREYLLNHGADVSSLGTPLRAAAAQPKAVSTPRPSVPARSEDTGGNAAQAHEVIRSSSSQPARRIPLLDATAAELQAALRFNIFGQGPAESGLIPVGYRGRYGYVDTQGRWVYPPQFMFADAFVDGRARVSWDRSGLNWIDPAGHWLGPVDSRDDTAKGYQRTGAPVLGRQVIQSVSDSRYGVVEESGKIILPPVLDLAVLLPDGNLLATKEGRSGVMDLAQNWLWTAPDGAKLGYYGELDKGVIALGGREHVMLVDYKAGRVLVSDLDAIQTTRAGLVPAARAAKWGFIDRRGNWVVPPKYDRVEAYVGSRALVFLRGRGGWIDASGREVFWPDISVHQLTPDGLAVAEKGCLQGVLDASGHWTVPPEFDEIRVLGEGIYSVQVEGAYGLVTGQGRFLTYRPSQPRTLEEVSPDISHGGWQYIGIHGEALGSDILDDASDFSEGHAVFAVNGRYGAIDVSGHTTVPPVFSRGLHDFHQGLAAAPGRSGTGYIDGECHWVIPPVYAEAEDFSNGVARVARQEKGAQIWLAIDRSGHELTADAPGAKVYDTDMHEGLRRLGLNGKWGFVDEKGQWVISARFDDERSFSEDAAAVELDGKWGYVGRDGQLIVEPQFDAAGDFHEGLARIEKDGRWTFVDSKGKTLPTTFLEAGDFSSGVARAHSIQGGWGFIDRTGAWQIQPLYSDAGDFVDGRARVRLHGYREGLPFGKRDGIEGKTLRPDGVGWFGSGMGYICARRAFGGCALVNAAGELLIPEEPPSLPVTR